MGKINKFKFLCIRRLPNAHTGPTVAFLLGFVIVSAIMVIRMRHTRSHTANRRSHHGLKTPSLATCSNCGAFHRPHHMCLECGFYKGKMVMDLSAKKKDRESRVQAKREMKKGEAESEAPEHKEEVKAEALPEADKK